MAATSSGVIAIILLIYCYIQQIDGFYRLKDTLGCFKLYSARYLEKSGTKYLNGYDDVTQCLSECLNSNENHKFICKSIMWKLDSKDCILSKYNTSDKTRNFKQAPGMQIDLYENQCLKRPNLNDEFEILFNMDLERTTTEQPSRNLTSSWILNNASQQVEAIIDNINNQQITTILNNQPTTQNVQSINNQPPINSNTQPPIQNAPPPIEAPPLKMRLFKPWDKPVQRNRTKHLYQHGTRQFAIDGEGRRHREFRSSTHDDVDNYDDLDSAVISEDVVGEFDEDSEKELVVKDELPPAKISQPQNPENLNPIPVRATPPQVMPISLPLPNRSPLIQNIQNLQNGPPRNQLLQHSMNQINQFQQQNQQNQQLTAQSGQSVSVLRMQMQPNHQFGLPPQRNVIFYPTATLQQGGLNPHVNRQLGQIPPATFQGMIYQAPHNQQNFGRYEIQRGNLLNPLTTTESPFIFVPGRGYVPRFSQQPPQTVFRPQSPLQPYPSMPNQHSQPQMVYHQQPNFTPNRPQNGFPLNFQQNQQNGPSQSAPQNSQAPRWGHPQQQHQQQTMMNNFQPQTQPITQNSLNQFQPKPNFQTPNQFFQNQGPPQVKIAQPQPQTVTPTLITGQPKPSASQVDQIQFFRGMKKDVDPNPSQLQPLIPIQEPNPSQIRRKAVHGVGTYEPRADEIIYDNFFPRDYEPTERKTKCFRRYSSKALAHFEEKTIIGGSLKDCLLACQNMLEFLCASVNYYDLKKICILNGGNTELNTVKLMDSHRYNYFENICASRGISTALAAPLQKISNFEVNKCFIEKRRNLLLTLDGTIIRNANTIEKCLKECLQRRPKCAAVNWLSRSQGCMLFKSSYDPSLLMPTDRGNFYINNCQETSFSRRKRTGRTQEMTV